MSKKKLEELKTKDLYGACKSLNCQPLVHRVNPVKTGPVSNDK